MFKNPFPFRDPYFELQDPVEHPPLDLEKTALLVIDMQYLDAHPDYGFGAAAKKVTDETLRRRLAYRWEGIAAIIPNIQKLQQACRQKGIEIIHIRIANRTRDGRDGVPTISGRGVAVPEDSKEAQILEELAPVGDEIVISKTSAGTFNSTNLDQVLHNLGIEQLLVTGIVTNGCVEITARDAADRGYWVTLISDGCSASTPELHANALERLTDGDIILAKTTEEALQVILDAQTK
jgi:nicotinamidase-related amidase